MKQTRVLQGAECTCKSGANHLCIKIIFFTDFSEDVAAFPECLSAEESSHRVADKSPLPARYTAVFARYLEVSVLAQTTLWLVKYPVGSIS